MDKVTVIGFKNSGKTCYTAGMYNTMSMGIQNFSLLEPNMDKDWYLQQIWEKICDGDNREWPVPSDDKISYTFVLSHSFEEIMKFEWLDYPGAALVDPGYGLLEDLQSQLGESSSLFVLINGESFAWEGDPASKKRITAKDEDEYKKKVAGNLKRNKDLMAIKKLAQIGLGNEMLPPIAIVVTKSDLIEDRWISCVGDIIKENFKPVFGEGSQGERAVMITAVTLGEGIENGADADPENIEEPIAYAVLSTLCKYIVQTRIAKNNNTTQLNKKDTFWGRILHPEKLEELRRNIDKNEENIRKFSKDARRLTELFPEDKPIYINNQRRSFREYFINIIDG